MVSYFQSSPPAERAIDILADLIGFDTVSSNSNLALMRYVEEHLTGLGVSVELLPDETGHKANLFATVGPECANGVILSGHTDVVPVTGQHWESDPFSLTRRGNRLYGRGTADMKSFIACILAALESAELDVLKRPIHLAFSHDEEVGCLGAPQLIEHLASSIKLPAATIVGEPSLMHLVGSHKSVHLFKVSVTGIPAHSSSPQMGVSANALAVRLMSALLETAERLREPEMQDAAFDPPFSTLTIGLMEGGTAANILAADASFVFDLRCLPDQDPDQILEAFTAEIDALRRAHPAATITVATQAAVPPLARAANGAAERLVRSVTGENAAMLAVSFGAEAGQFQEAGFSTVICGPGSMDQGHQPDEFVEVGEIEKCVRFLDRLFKTMREPATAG